MVPRVGMPSIATRTGAVLAVIATLAGCGSSAGSNATARRGFATDASTPSRPGSCPATVLETLVRVAKRIYREGVASERTAVATHAITTSIPLREAVQHGDAQGARAAAEALLASGRMTDLLIRREGRVLADVGAPNAVAPLRGTLTGASGAPIGRFVTSVWADDGVIAETSGVTSGSVALRVGGRSIAGSFALPPGKLPARGQLTVHGVEYRFSSFPARIYPSGGLRVYLLRSVRSTAPLCGRTEQDTVVNTLSRVARLIYDGEIGGRALTQVHRVQNDPALLSAVARREEAGTRRAVERLLNQHIVRLRVSAAHRLLSDVGGPFVLGPVGGSLIRGGREIGSFVLSIQDDEGYLRLTRRLVGLDVLMRMGSQLVKNSLGPAPGAVPASGSYRYRSRSFRVFTIAATAFPAGPLQIQVLVPIPFR
ncbi:MAG: hypothetical protein ACHQAV_01515 [Solirubrobacterales bacterium]